MRCAASGSITAPLPQRLLREQELAKEALRIGDTDATVLTE
jgi:hypothetical protein